MTTWHVDAEEFARTVAADSLPDDVPVVMYVPTSAGAKTPHVVVGPATCTQFDTAMSLQRSTARMDIQLWAAAAGDTPTHIERLSEIADLLVNGLAAAGADSITTQTRQTTGDLMPTYARMVTASITLTDDC